MSSYFLILNYYYNCFIIIILITIHPFLNLTFLKFQLIDQNLFIDSFSPICFSQSTVLILILTIGILLPLNSQFKWFYLSFYLHPFSVMPAVHRVPLHVGFSFVENQLFIYLVDFIIIIFFIIMFLFKNLSLKEHPNLNFKNLIILN